MTMRSQQWICLAVSLAVHAAVLYGLGRSQWVDAPALPTALSVKLLAPPMDKSQPQAAPVVDPQPPRHLARQRVAPIAVPQKLPHVTTLEKHPSSAGAFTPIRVTEAEAQAQAAVTPPPLPQHVAPDPVTMPAAKGTTVTAVSTSPGSPNTVQRVPFQDAPVALATDLALVCPDKSPADYPMLSRRLNEFGTVLLRVEVDERGAIAAAAVDRSSGFTRLDAAALAAVRTWHCRAPTHNGQPVRATALQPFHFKLED